ncbi:MAG: hypothetical protein RSD57_15280 [Comamonas sp.]
MRVELCNNAQRDAKVAALCDQVNIERQLTGDDNNRACSGQ